MSGVVTMDRFMQGLARLAGTTSRTLRHYGDVGLWHRAASARTGYRCYDDGAL